MAEAEILLSVRGLCKGFGDFRAVNNLSVDIRKGEVFSLLGASGCGKSTTLRMIAGLEQPDSGEIILSGKPVFSAGQGAGVAPQKRNMGMVFQSYAIWPHLSVFDTVAYPLVVRKTPADEITRRVDAMLKLVGLDGFQARFSSTLSGGQQQRVALARALVYEPDLLLLDEPFSNLDVHLREQMRVEVKLLQRRLGVTVILVTHDQVEALSLSDRVGVMNGGRIVQIGSPAELYENPQTPFVRDFIGKSFHIPARAFRQSDGGLAYLTKGGVIFKARPSAEGPVKADDRVILSVRSENLQVQPAEMHTGENALSAEILTALFIGDKHECLMQVEGETIRCFLPRTPGRSFGDGDKLTLVVPESEVMAWPT